MLSAATAAPARFHTLELRGLGRDHGHRTALADLSLTVSAGEFIALLGPSGAGKSTALHCVAGLLVPSRGSVLIDGRPIDAVPPEHRDFSIVFQHHALFPHLSVRDNVAFGLAVRHLPSDEVWSRTTEALERVGLADHADRRPSQLSGGQQQRVAIARAIVVRPRLLLMDEPLSDLDPALRLDLRGEIKRLHRELGLTTLYVTHDREEALSMADRLVVLREGRTEQIGSPRVIHDAPQTWQVAEFVGHRNILPGRVADRAVAGSRVEVILDEGHRLSGTAAADLAAGTEVRMAVRPEHLSVRLESGWPSASVVVTEYLGRDFGVTLDAQGRRLHARSTVDLPIDATVTLAVDPERALVFPASR